MILGDQDGTWDAIKGSCTVVRYFTDFCYFTYSQLLKEPSAGSGSDETHTIRSYIHSSFRLSSSNLHSIRSNEFKPTAD